MSQAETAPFLQAVPVPQEEQPSEWSSKEAVKPTVTDEEIDWSLADIEKLLTKMDPVWIKDPRIQKMIQKELSDDGLSIWSFISKAQPNSNGNFGFKNWRDIHTWSKKNESEKSDRSKPKKYQSWIIDVDQEKIWRLLAWYVELCDFFTHNSREDLKKDPENYFDTLRDKLNEYVRYRNESFYFYENKISKEQFLKRHLDIEGHAHLAISIARGIAKSVKAAKADPARP